MHEKWSTVMSSESSKLSVNSTEQSIIVPLITKEAQELIKQLYTEDYLSQKNEIKLSQRELPKYTSKLLTETLKFLKLKIECPNMYLTCPTEIVNMWKAFVLCTKQYREFCNQYNKKGNYIDFDPTKVKINNTESILAYETAKIAYEKIFHNDPPKNIWYDIIKEESFQLAPSNKMTINETRNILKKPKEEMKSSTVLNVKNKSKFLVSPAIKTRRPLSSDKISVKQPNNLSKEILSNSSSSLNTRSRQRSSSNAKPPHQYYKEICEIIYDNKSIENVTNNNYADESHSAHSIESESDEQKLKNSPTKSLGKRNISRKSSWSNLDVPSCDEENKEDLDDKKNYKLRKIIESIDETSVNGPTETLNDDTENIETVEEDLDEGNEDSNADNKDNIDEKVNFKKVSEKPDENVIFPGKKLFDDNAVEVYFEKYKKLVDESRHNEFRKHLDRSKSMKTRYRFLIYEKEFIDDFLMGYGVAGRRDNTGLHIGFASCS